jgi:hypothetical protein
MWTSSGTWAWSTYLTTTCWRPSSGCGDGRWTRPFLWEIWFLTGSQVGCYVRVHDAIVDGVSGVATLAALLA